MALRIWAHRIDQRNEEKCYVEKACNRIGNACAERLKKSLGRSKNKTTPPGVSEGPTEDASPQALVCANSQFLKLSVTSLIQDLSPDLTRAARSVGNR